MMFPKELINQWTWLASANENIGMVQVREGVREGVGERRGEGGREGCFYAGRRYNSGPGWPRQRMSAWSR